MVKTGQLVVREFITIDNTGLPVAATVGPTGKLVLNGTDNGAAVTIANPAVGRYTWSVTMPALTAGDSVDMRIAATVGGIATEGIVWQDTADKYVNDLNDAAAAPAMITGQQVRDAMLLDASAGAPAAGSVDQHLDDAALEATIATLMGAGWTMETLEAIFACTCGSGSVVFIYTLTDSTTGLPIAGALIWVTTDLAGLNPVAQGYSNALGQVQFMLAPGNAYFWRQKAGYTFVNPDLEVV
jgi:hypothetical protein